MPPSPISPGTMLGGRYRLEDLLAEHDGARFWRGTDTVLARSVAVHALDSGDPRAEHVLDAARQSARVSDPHFLRVLDCDDVDGLTWVINEWGEGASLDIMLERSTLPPTRAAWLTREVAEAIAAAHAQGLHHGRLNPESVLVTDSGSVKVIGFVVNAAFEGPARAHPAYGALDPREADVIDLAGILYAALTGRWPGVTSSKVPAAPREGRRPLRPRQVRAGVPRTLDAICDRVLHKEAAQHVLPIETAHEIAAALSDYVGDPAAAAPVDVPSMYAEPEPAAPEPEPEPVPDLPGLSSPRPPQPSPQLPAQESAPDPEETMAAPAPLWVEEHAEPEEWRAEPTPAPQPAPPPADAPVRPLFADHERRVPPGAPVVAAPSTSPSRTPPTSSDRDEVTDGTGTSTGSRYWPFDDPEETGGFSGKEGRSWLQLAAVVALCVAVVVAVFIAFGLGRGKPQPAAAPTTPPASPTETETGSPIKIVSVHDFDPEGDPPEENPDQVGLAVDGNPDTGWRTLTYKGDAALGGLKSGVGLVLDLGSEQTVGSVQVRLGGSPTDLELFATPPGDDNPPVELADTRRVTGATADQASTVLRVDPAVRTRFLVVWLTRLPPVTGGFRGEIAEVAVRS